jgi:amino acid transporter
MIETCVSSVTSNCFFYYCERERFAQSLESQLCSFQTFSIGLFAPVLLSSADLIFNWHMEHYKKNSLSLTGAIAMGTGVMIGAGIFSLTGQIAELSGELFPYAFMIAALIAALSSYAYIKMSQQFPSAGGIAMYLQEIYGKGVITAFNALLMYFTMVMAQSLLARTFATYTLQLFEMSDQNTFWIRALGVGVLLIAFLINLLGNKVIGRFSKITALAKIAGVLAFALLGLWVADISPQEIFPTSSGSSSRPLDFIAGVALAILAFKGFTTITNSGSELKDPKKNLGRAISLSLAICFVLYFLVASAVGTNLNLSQIIAAKDYSLAEAVRPALGDKGVLFTVIIAIIATISGIIASAFAVSRMLAMLTKMKLVPHSHFGMPGSIQKHTLVYTIVMAIILTVLFDLSRIASIGIIFYLVMDIFIQWGAFHYLRREIKARPIIILLALSLDLIALGAFIMSKVKSDPLIVWISLAGMILIFLGERLFLHSKYLSSNEAYS